MMLSTGTANFMSEFAFHGPSISVFADCATGNAALVLAKLWLNSGFASDVIVMATDLSSTPDNIRGFVDARVAVVDQPPFEANRPFQTGSKGFVGGEASVAMVLSPSPTGARATLHGGSTTSDGYSPISIAPDRIQLRRCYQEALTRSGVRAEDIVYFNAHGSGTAMCDAAESDLFDELFPTAEGIYSIKPFVGHCQTAASAVEVFAILYSYETGFIPAPPRVSPAHPRLLNGPKPCSPGLTLKSGVGMGGQNTAVILGDSPAG
jgi:3-oxoacyl-[acyl-carrier-protein] synthase II